MRLLFSQTSPYARMVRVVAYETGLVIELTPVDTMANDPDLLHANPLSKVPTLVLADGQSLFDSRVICEYLDTTGGGASLTPSGPERWQVLRQQALGVGILDAAYAIVTEGRRPEAAERSARAVARWRAAILRALDALEAAPRELQGAFNIAHVALACALGYLDFRLPELTWRDGRPNLAEAQAVWAARPSVASTLPEG